MTKFKQLSMFQKLCIFVAEGHLSKCTFSCFMVVGFLKQHLEKCANLSLDVFPNLVSGNEMKATSDRGNLAEEQFLCFLVYMKRKTLKKYVQIIEMISVNIVNLICKSD